MSEQDILIKKFQKEMNAGTAALLLLRVVEQNGQPMYGYQIAKMLEDRSERYPLMKQGALYPVLHSLEKTGLLLSAVEPSVSGPPRRYYGITDQGRQVLQKWMEIWQQTSAFVNSVLEGVH